MASASGSGRGGANVGKGGKTGSDDKAGKGGKGEKGGKGDKGGKAQGGKGGKGLNAGKVSPADPVVPGAVARRGWFELSPSCRPDVLLHLPGDLMPGFDGSREEAELATERLRLRLFDLQDRLYAQGRHKILVVLQAMDTGGKDGTIQKVFSGVNPIGVRVARFERPTPNELAHDYLWRVHAQVPATGQIVIFNRSHYEDVLVVRVNGLVPEAVWRRRYRHLREFEQLLADEGTTILKFYLHIDAHEQHVRLQARLDEPDKRWKFDPGDLEQRKRWNEYMGAFRDAIVETDRPDAPWYVIPANRKWFRDYAVLSILVQTLERLDPQYPPADFDPTTIVIP